MPRSDYPSVLAWLAALRSQPSILLYTVHHNLQCRCCGHKGAVKALGKWYPQENYLASVLGPGGCIPYRCPNCGASGLAGLAMETLRDAFVVLPEVPQAEGSDKAVYTVDFDLTCRQCGQGGGVSLYGVLRDGEVDGCAAVGGVSPYLCTHCGNNGLVDFAMECFTVAFDRKDKEPDHEP